MPDDEKIERNDLLETVLAMCTILDCQQVAGQLGEMLWQAGVRRNQPVSYLYDRCLLWERKSCKHHVESNERHHVIVSKIHVALADLEDLIIGVECEGRTGGWQASLYVIKEALGYPMCKPEAPRTPQEHWLEMRSAARQKFIEHTYPDLADQALASDGDLGTFMSILSAITRLFLHGWDKDFPSPEKGEVTSDD